MKKLVCLVLALALYAPVAYAKSCPCYALGGKAGRLGNEPPIDDKITEIILEPEEVVAKRGESIQFMARAFTKDGQERWPLFDWSANPPELGRITQNGLFTATTAPAGDVLKGFVEARAQGTGGKASIVVDKHLSSRVTANLVADPPQVDFGEIPQGQGKAVIVKVTNTGEKEAIVILSTHDVWYTASPTEFTAAPGQTIEVEFSILKQTFPKCGHVTAFATLSWGGGVDELTLPVIARAQGRTASGIAAAPPELDFGFVERGKTKALTFTLSFDMEKEAKVKVENLAPWLELDKPSGEYETKDKAVKVTATITGSLLPGKESFESELVVKAEGYCEDFKVRIFGTTDRMIRIVMTMNKKTAKINDTEVQLDVPLEIRSGRTMTPLRFIAEALGCKAEYEPKERKITLTRLDSIVVLWVGKPDAQVNGKAAKLDTPPVIKRGRTLVPVRFISQVFEANVTYDQTTRSVTILFVP